MALSDEKMVTIINVIQDLHKRVQRLEALQGLIEYPEEWGITRERIIEIMEAEGIPYDEAQQRLTLNFGGEA